MRIAHFGTFDVENYGDLLFPLVLERRLASLGAEFVHVSPIGGPSIPYDGRPTISLREAFDSEFDAVIVGGGNIVHARATSLDRYRTDPETARLGYAGIWLGASELAARLGTPLVWNAPGVPAAFGPATAPFVAWAAATCDRLAVRDGGSAQRLRGAGFAGALAIVPDTAIDVAELWTAAKRRAAHRDAFVSRGMAEIPKRTVFLHLNERYATEDPGGIAERVERLARQLDAVPILGALGPCHGDGELARRVGRAISTPVLVLDGLRGLCEVAACIEASVAYVGSSLHGLITACAFGRPAILVARESSRGAAKFSGFLAQWPRHPRDSVHSDPLWVSSWDDAEARIGPGEAFVESESAAVGESVSFGALPNDRLDAHWRTVEQVLRRPRAECKSRRTDSRQVLDRLLTRGAQKRPLFQAVLDDQGAVGS